MADETKRLDSSSEETKRLQKETEKLVAEETEKLGADPKRAFSIFLTEGQTIKKKGRDRYKVMSMLGQRSGESLPYLCEDTEEKKKVVLKLYHVGFSPKEEIVRKLIEVTHQDIINILDFGYIGHQFYEVMEYAEGGTLLERLQERPFSEEELTRYVISEVLSGLKFCHENEITHRDIKPANIFYRDREKKDIVIGDFGISSLLEKGLSVKMSKGKMTFDYAAPELFVAKDELIDGKIERIHHIGKEIDYYALGMTLIHLLIGGESPFPKLSDYEIMRIHCTERITPPGNISDRFKKLISGLLVKERKKRWGASEIERWLRGEDIPVYKDEIDEIKVYAIPPYKFTANAIAKTPKELAMLIQTFGDREVVKKHFSEGWFSNWLGSLDQDLAYKVAEIEEKARDIDLALLEVSYILDPEMPYILLPGNQAETPEELARLIDENWEVGKEHIFSGEVSLWLKHAGHQDIYKRLEQIRGEFRQEQDRGVEIFLQLLGLPKPEFIINPSALDVGVIESTAGVVRSRGIKLSRTDKRGYLYGEIRFSESFDGISFAMKDISVLTKGVEEEKQRLTKLLRDAEARRDKKTFLELAHKLKELEKSHPQKGLKEVTPATIDVIKINLWPSESIEFNLKIDTEELIVNKKYEFSIFTKTNAAADINLPVSFLVDYPAYSNKQAKKPIEVNDKKFFTLKDLSEYYHGILLSKPDISYLLDTELATWVKDDLGENQLAQKVKDIISADIAFSEKCYRFLKLCGVFERKKLIDLFKKMRIKEFEAEKENRIAEVKNDIKKRRAKERNNYLGNWIKWGAIIGVIMGIIEGIIMAINFGYL